MQAASEIKMRHLPAVDSRSQYMVMWAVDKHLSVRALEWAWHCAETILR